MRKLRIAQVAPYYHPHVGGVESHVESVSVELAARGHDVEVLTSQLEGAPTHELRDGVHIQRVPESGNLFTTPITPRLMRALSDGSYDIIHAHSPPPLTAWYAARAARRMRTPFILTHHCDLEIPILGGGAIVEVFRRTLGRATVRAADAVIATTRTYAQTSRSLWSRTDVKVVPNAVDERRFAPEPTSDHVRTRHFLGTRKIALFVGRVTYHKGIEDFIRAAQWTDEDTVHLIVGDGPRRAAFERLAADVAPDRVVFAGRVDARHLPDYYREASVGVLPSTSRLEAFGIAALECMASGTPVIVSRIPGVEEVIEDQKTGLLTEPLDAKDLGAKIRAVCRDEEAARSMGKAGRERVLSRFTIGRVVDELEAVYAGVI